MGRRMKRVGEASMTDPSADGMVQCSACAGLRSADKGGGKRLVCIAFPERPSLVSEKWRRCQKYIERKTK